MLTTRLAVRARVDSGPAVAVVGRLRRRRSSVSSPPPSCSRPGRRCRCRRSGSDTMLVAASPDALTRSAPADVLIVSVSLAGSAFEKLTANAVVFSATEPAPPGEAHDVGAAVPLTVTASTAPSPSAVDAEVDVDERDVGRGEIVHGRRVDAAERVQLSVSTSSVSMTMFPTFRVKSSRPPFDDAAKISAPAEPLNRSVSTSVLALDDVAAVARIPDERVVARRRGRRCRCPGYRRSCRCRRRR